MNDSPASTTVVAGEAEVSNVKRVIFASSVGTLFEWYDFYLYGSLATFFGGLFFPKVTIQRRSLRVLRHSGLDLRCVPSVHSYSEESVILSGASTRS